MSLPSINYDFTSYQPGANLKKVFFSVALTWYSTKRTNALHKKIIFLNMRKLANIDKELSSF